MKFSASTAAAAIVFCLVLYSSEPESKIVGVEGKKSPHASSSSAAHRGRRSPSSRSASRSASRPASRPTSTSPKVGRKSSPSAPVSRRQMEYDEEDEDGFEDVCEDPNFDDDFDESEEHGVVEEDEDLDEEDFEEDDFDLRGSSPKSNASSKRPPPSASRPRSSRRPPPTRGGPSFEDEYEDDDYYDEPRGNRPPSTRRSSSHRASYPPPRSRSSRSRGRSGSASGGRGHGRGRGRGSVVPYTNHRRRTESSFTRGLSALKENLPDPNVMKSNALNAMAAAKAHTSKISKDFYREVKGLTSSELEQVMLKATRPDDTPVKGKHVERLVGVTYQISGRYDIYDAVLRKLWKKMAEGDWRTKIKSLYILHRFSSDGAPDHQQSLKQRLRQLRRTRDPKSKDKEKYFNSKRLLAVSDPTPENAKYRAFLSRYTHYVLLRVQSFGGMFAEISEYTPPSSSSNSKKSSSNSSTDNKPPLHKDHLDGITMMLKAGMATTLREGEDSEQTAVAMERVAVDMIAMTTATATALNRALKNYKKPNHMVDDALLKQWCEFYAEELLPKTKILVKKTSPKLDKYGLFLPSRMGAAVRPELLEKGLTLGINDTAQEKKQEDVNNKQEQIKTKLNHDNNANEQSPPSEKSTIDTNETKYHANKEDEKNAEQDVEHETENDTEEDDQDVEDDEDDQPDNNQEKNNSHTSAANDYEEEYDYEEEEYYDEE